MDKLTQKERDAAKRTARQKEDRDKLGKDENQYKTRIANRPSKTKHAKIEELSLKNRGIEKNRLLDEMTVEVKCKPKLELMRFLDSVAPLPPPRQRRAREP